MADIKAYRPAANSLGAGQVLQCPYPFDKARLVAQEMAGQLALDLLEKRLVTSQIVLTVGYDIENLTNPAIRSAYHGTVTTDFYGRKVPGHAHGTANLGAPTSSAMRIVRAVTDLFGRIVDSRLLVRRITLAAGRVTGEDAAARAASYEQLDLFTDYAAAAKEKAALARERSMQQTVLHLKHKYGKNAVLRGMDLQEGATAISRNGQIGGHKA